MTPSEFKAWFEGFTEAFDKPPTKAQWDRVKARVAEIDGRAVTETVWHRYAHYLHYPVTWGMSGGAAGGGGGNNAAGGGGGSSSFSAIGSGGAGGFDSHGAMGALGRAEALAVGA